MEDNSAFAYGAQAAAHEPGLNGSEPADQAGHAGHAGRLMGIAGALLTVHLEVAKHEVSEEQARIVRGIALMAVGWMCLFAVILMFQAVAVLSLHELAHLRWLFASLITMGTDLVLFLVMRRLGSHQLKAPVLPATRAMVRKTISALRN